MNVPTIVTVLTLLAGATVAIVWPDRMPLMLAVLGSLSRKRPNGTEPEKRPRRKRQKPRTATKSTKRPDRGSKARKRS